MGGDRSRIIKEPAAGRRGSFTGLSPVAKALGDRPRAPRPTNVATCHTRNDNGVKYDAILVPLRPAAE